MSNEFWILLSIVSADLAILILAFLVLKIIRLARYKGKYGYATAQINGEYYKLYPVGKKKAEDGDMDEDVLQLRVRRGKNAAAGNGAAAPKEASAQRPYANNVYTATGIFLPGRADEPARSQKARGTEIRNVSYRLRIISGLQAMYRKNIPKRKRFFAVEGGARRRKGTAAVFDCASFRARA